MVSSENIEKIRQNLRDEYGYDDMSDDEKKAFDEKADAALSLYESDNADGDDAADGSDSKADSEWTDSEDAADGSDSGSESRMSQSQKTKLDMYERFKERDHYEDMSDEDKAKYAAYMESSYRSHFTDTMREEYGYDDMTDDEIKYVIECINEFK